MDDDTNSRPKRAIAALIVAAVLAAGVWLAPVEAIEPLKQSAGIRGWSSGLITALAGLLGFAMVFGIGELAERRSASSEEFLDEDDQPDENEQRRRPLQVREELGFEAEHAADQGLVEAVVTEEPEAIPPPDEDETRETVLEAPAPAPAPRTNQALDHLSLPELRARLEHAVAEWRGEEAPPVPNLQQADGGHMQLRAALERLAALDNGKSTRG